MASIVGGSITFRFIVLGKDIFKSFLPNLILLFIAFVCQMWGFGTLFIIAMDFIGHAVKVIA